MGATGQSAIFDVLRWKFSFLVRGEMKILRAAGLSRRETPQCGYCVNIWKPIAFYSEEIFSSSLAIPVVCKDHPPLRLFCYQFVLSRVNEGFVWTQKKNQIK